MPPRTVGISNLNVGGTDKRYLPFSHRPYIGKNPLMTGPEYQALTRTVCVGAYGTFDTARPEQKAHGRTLDEVLTRLASGEYRLFCPIDRKWVKDKKHGLRQMLSIQWIEYYDADSSDINKLTRPRR